MLQSRAPGTWSLKMPSHAVHIEALLATYPDARIVWAHRDPFQATASFLRLNYLSRSVMGADIDQDSIVANVSISCTRTSPARFRPASASATTASSICTMRT